MPIKLYTNHQTRGVFIEWYIKELGLADAEIVALDYANGEHKSKKYTEVSPFQRIPAIEDDGLKLHESGAIQLYLAEKYEGFSSLQERAIATKWVFLGQTTLADAFFNDPKGHKDAVLTALNKALEGREYLTGKFSAPDVSVASTLIYAGMATQFDFAPYPAVNSYIQRLKQRPAYKETIPF